MKARVKFDKPPVVEVACGVLFATSAPIKGTDVGLFWQTVRDEFPRAEEAPPLPAFIEANAFDTDGIPEISVGPLPPLRRSWLVSGDGRHLIQVQEDRFLFNWKKATDDVGYTSYDVVIENFERYFGRFVAFLAERGLTIATYRQFELSYINFVGIKNGLSVTGPSKLLVDHRREDSRERFLPEPETINWSSAYTLPGTAGRLHVNAQTALYGREREPIVRLEVTARGITTDTTATGRRAWFDLAHEWITHGFADLTAPELHEKDVWGRTA